MANEVRLIDANALIEKAYWHGKHPTAGNPYPEGAGAVDMSDIDAAPTIDPESLSEYLRSLGYEVRKCQH